MPSVKRSRQLTRTVSFKLTPNDYRRLEVEAANSFVSVSEFSRGLALSALSRRYESLLQMQFSAVGEERVRLIFEAAQKGQKLGSIEAHKQIEQEATIAAVKLTADRIAVLEQLRLQPVLEGGNNAE